MRKFRANQCCTALMALPSAELAMPRKATCFLPDGEVRRGLDRQPPHHLSFSRRFKPARSSKDSRKKSSTISSCGGDPIGTKCRWIVVDLEPVFGNRHFDIRIQSASNPRQDSLAIDFDTISRPQIADEPISFLDFQQAMVAGDIAKIEDDIATFTTANSKSFLHQRNWVSATNGNKFTVHDSFANQIRAVQRNEKLPIGGEIAENCRCLPFQSIRWPI